MDRKRNKCADDECFRSTDHHTGLCPKHRTVDCKTCGKTFVYTTRASDYCSDHRGKPQYRQDQEFYHVEGSE